MFKFSQTLASRAAKERSRCFIYPLAIAQLLHNITHPPCGFSTLFLLSSHLFIRVFLIWLCFCQWIPSVPPTANVTHSARRPPLLAYVETASQISMLGKLWAVHRCLFRFILVSLSRYTTQTSQWGGEINATPEMNCKPAVS